MNDGCDKLTNRQCNVSFLFRSHLIYSCSAKTSAIILQISYYWNKWKYNIYFQFYVNVTRSSWSSWSSWKTSKLHVMYSIHFHMNMVLKTNWCSWVTSNGLKCDSKQTNKTKEMYSVYFLVSETAHLTVVHVCFDRGWGEMKRKGRGK